MADDLRRNISLKLASIARQMRAHFDEAVAELGVTRSQWTVVMAVSRRPGLTQRAVAEALEISEASAGRLIDRLANEGLVERRPKEDDKRAYAVFLTDAGERLTGQLSEVGRQSESTAYGGIPEEDLQQLEKLLETIAGNLVCKPEQAITRQHATTGCRTRRFDTLRACILVALVTKCCYKGREPLVRLEGARQPWQTSSTIRPASTASSSLNSPPRRRACWNRSSKRSASPMWPTIAARTCSYGVRGGST
jgi:MarR family transcriptional regulator for hemolysin